MAKVVDIILHRKKLVAGVCTLGCIAIGAQNFYTVEDVVRPLTCTDKVCTGIVRGKTAIQAGRYEVIDTYSPRFKRNVLLLLGVPGFSGIRIHSGNTADDTEGCLILGTVQTSTGVANSRAAIVAFNEYVRNELKSGRVFITIKNPTELQP